MADQDRDRDRWTVRSLAQRVEKGAALEDILGGRPTLVLRHGSEVGTGHIYTPDQALLRRQREGLPDTSIYEPSHSETQIAIGTDALTELAYPENRVASLIKSKRNPFAGMITVGRAKNNDVVLASPSVSKIHCFLHQSGDEWLIEDNGTTNGTRLDGVALPPKQRVPIRSGMAVDFGGVVALYVEADALKLILEMSAAHSG